MKRMVETDIRIRCFRLLTLVKVILYQENVCKGARVCGLMWINIGELENLTV